MTEPQLAGCGAKVSLVGAVVGIATNGARLDVVVPDDIDLDALGPLLGTTDPARQWHPRDGRILRLGLHRHLDPALGNEVDLAISARALGGTDLDRDATPR